jgi:nicotinate-nucleotide adenylyltransferase
LRRRYGAVELQMVIGEDLLDQLPSWYAWEELSREISFLILPRWGAGTGEPPPQHRRLNAPRLEISSSLVRRRLASGYTMEHWLPPGVWDYIREHELYGWHEK